MEDANGTGAEPIDLTQLAREVRVLRGLVLAILALALVILTTLNLGVFFSISKYRMIFDEMLGDQPLPGATRLTVWMGSSPAVLFALTLLPIGSMAWLWLERQRPALPVFVMLCLCVMMTVFLLWTRLTLAQPLHQIITGLGGI